MAMRTKTGCKGNISLVEREAELRAFLAGILTDAGYAVFACVDGYEAYLSKPFTSAICWSRWSG